MSVRHNVGFALAGAAVAAAATTTLAGQVRPPEAQAAPSTSTATSTTTTSASAYPVDDRGFVDSEARCDEGQMLMAFGRTSRALVAICVAADGELIYRGVRLSDKAASSMPAERAADGAVIATNNGVTYAVSPQTLLVSEGDTVLYRDSWLEFHQPRFSGPAATSTATSTTTTSSATTSSAATSSAVPTTTVSTTTVTLTPETAKPSS